VAGTDERENLSEERENLTEDVEAHGITENASDDLADASSDESDVEAHSLTELPPAD
jgi:hypothetical protein